MRKTDAGEFVLHPLGTLTIRQSVVPLGVRIDRFGRRSRPGGDARFEIVGASVGGHGAQTTAVREHFARSEFFDLSEEQAYGGPSFEAMPAGVSVGNTVVSSGPSVDAPLDFVPSSMTRRPTASNRPTPMRCPTAISMCC